MDLTSLLQVALIIAWTVIPIMIIQYRLVVVPKRFEEIRYRFLSPPSRKGRGSDKAKHSPGLLYARLLYPEAREDEAKKIVTDQFWFFHSWSRYVVPLALVVVLTGVMLYGTGLWVADRLGQPSGASAWLSKIDTPFVMALWGAFVWSLYEIWARRKSGDLTPVEVGDVALRIVVAIPVGYAFSLLVFEGVSSVAAFAASAFPLRDVRQFFRKWSLQRLGVSAEGTTARGYLLTALGNDTIVRLQELNVETYLDLAYADPVRLMVKTGAPIQLVLAWIDQALLAVYVSTSKPTFEALGMPCALDVRKFYEDHFIRGAGDWRNDAAVKALAAALSIPLEILPHVLHSIYDDPHVQFLAAAWYDVDATPDDGAPHGDAVVPGLAAGSA